MTDASADWSSSAEAADRLGVKVQTLYAYVSRGQLTSHRRAGLPGTWFSLREIEEFARRQPVRNAPGRRPFAFKGVSSRVSSIDAGDLLLRDRDAVEVARSRTFADVIPWLVTGEDLPPGDPVPDAVRAEVRAATAGMPLLDDPIAGLIVAVTVAATRDPLRLDLGPGGLARSAGQVVEAMCATVSERSGDPPAAALATALSLAREPMAGARELLDMALVLLSDHGLAPSTVAARVAASTRADPYAVVVAGLATLRGPLHGAASRRVHRLLDRMVAGDDLERSLADHLQGTEGVLIGFGSAHYPDGDPRAAALLAHARDLDPSAPVLAALAELEQYVGPRSLPNVDAALAVVAHTAGLHPATGELVFAVARSAGWIAHAAEEYQEIPLRWRGS